MKKTKTKHCHQVRGATFIFNRGTLTLTSGCTRAELLLCSLSFCLSKFFFFLCGVFLDLFMSVVGLWRHRKSFPLCFLQKKGSMSDSFIRPRSSFFLNLFLFQFHLNFSNQVKLTLSFNILRPRVLNIFINPANTVLKSSLHIIVYLFSGSTLGFFKVSFVSAFFLQ